MASHNGSVKKLRHTEHYEWFKGDLIGEGNFGKVYKGRARRTGRLVAAKEYSSQKRHDYFENVEKLKNLQSPYIVQYLADEKVKSWKNDKRAIIMELGSCSVRDELKKTENYYGLSKDKFVTLVEHVAKALKCLHDARIAHRDLKPDNILIFENSSEGPVYKLTDFGLSKALASLDQVMETKLGTGPYMPSTVVKAVARKSDCRYIKDWFDMWSAACCFFECATGRHPFEPHISREKYYFSLDKLYAERPDNVVCTCFEPDSENVVYSEELPTQHASYSRCFRRILRQFFQKMFRKDKYYRQFENFNELCQELISLRHCEYYLINTSSMVEYYDTSSSRYFSRQSFEENVKDNALEVPSEPGSPCYESGRAHIVHQCSGNERAVLVSSQHNPIDLECRCARYVILPHEQRTVTLPRRLKNAGHQRSSCAILPHEQGTVTPPKQLKNAGMAKNESGEKAVTTYVSKSSSHFSQKVQIATFRICRVLKGKQEIERLVGFYEFFAKDLLTWVHRSISWLSSRTSDGKLDVVRKKLDDFRNYRHCEMPLRIKESRNLETLFAVLKSKMHSSNQPAFMETIGHLFHDIRAAWRELNNAEEACQKWLLSEMKRLDSTCEDLDLGVALDMKEIQDLIEAHNTVKATIPDSDAALKSISTAEQEIRNLVDQHGLDTELLRNPYTDLTGEEIHRQWLEVQLAVLKRNVQLQQKQRNNERLRKLFADQANSVGRYLVQQLDQALTVTLGGHGSPEDAISQLHSIHQQVVAYKPNLDELEDINQEMQEDLVPENDDTWYSMESLRGCWKSLLTSIHRTINECENQILMRDSKGITQEQLNECRVSFNKFDSDKQGLDHEQLKLCLISVGYNIRPGEEGDQDMARFLRILDPNRIGRVSFETFLDFIIEETGGTDSVEEMIDLFRTLAGGKTNISTDEIRRELPPEQAEYCIQAMSQFTTTNGCFDYVAYSHSIYDH